MTVFVANTNILDLTGLKSEVDGTYINDATVTVTVKDCEGNALTGATWPMTMVYQSGTDGNYRAILPDALQMVGRQDYFAVIDANAGVNRKGHWQYYFRAEDRTR